MEKEGYVSFWVGNTNSKENLDDILEVSYTDDGEFIPSIFAKSFDIQRYDDALRETEFYDGQESSLYKLLEGFSYDEVVVPKFLRKYGEELKDNYNTVILLYNFKYVGVNQSAVVHSNKIEFLGTVEYLSSL